MSKSLIITGTLLIVILLALGACEPAPTPATTPAPTPTPTPTPTNIIEDLAYIKAIGGEYSDDADPEPEGAEITILWYNSKSETILFDSVPVKVTIEILAANSEKFPRSFNESVYKGEHSIDNNHSNIRIPFEQIKANTEIHNLAGRANIAVHTPQQGDFSVEGVLVPLCPKPPIKPTPTPAPLPKT